MLWVASLVQLTPVSGVNWKQVERNSMLTTLLSSITVGQSLRSHYINWAFCRIFWRKLSFFPFFQSFNKVLVAIQDLAGWCDTVLVKVNACLDKDCLVPHNKLGNLKRAKVPSFLKGKLGRVQTQISGDTKSTPC